ncbi:MAG: hypothetical protein J5732_09760 [Bacteroidaceae bacterium]|nr:hypothetical protein [Bacteroidaceae bacterium]
MKEIDWTDHLAYLLNINSKVLASSHLKILEYHELDEQVQLNETDFLNDVICFPFYVDQLNKFDLAPYKFIKSDTSTIHFQARSIEKIVKEVIADQDNYVKAVLKWKYLDTEIITYALFDRNTKELVYDNILYNILIPDKPKANPMALTRSEPGGNGGGNGGHSPSSVLCYTSLHESVECWDNINNIISSADYQFFVYGNWNSVPVRDSLGVIIGYDYTFSYDNTVWYGNVFENRIYPEACAISSYDDSSYGSVVRIKFILWAGVRRLISNIPEYDNPSHIPNVVGRHDMSVYLGYNLYAEGFYEVVEISPTKNGIRF